SSGVSQGSSRRSHSLALPFLRRAGSFFAVQKRRVWAAPAGDIVTEARVQRCGRQKRSSSARHGLRHGVAGAPWAILGYFGRNQGNGGAEPWSIRRNTERRRC